MRLFGRKKEVELFPISYFAEEQKPETVKEVEVFPIDKKNAPKGA